MVGLLIFKKSTEVFYLIYRFVQYQIVIGGEERSGGCSRPSTPAHSIILQFSTDAGSFSINEYYNVMDRLLYCETTVKGIAYSKCETETKVVANCKGCDLLDVLINKFLNKFKS